MDIGHELKERARVQHEMLGYTLFFFSLLPALYFNLMLALDFYLTAPDWLPNPILLGLAMLLPGWGLCYLLACRLSRMLMDSFRPLLQDSQAVQQFATRMIIHMDQREVPHGTLILRDNSLEAWVQQGQDLRGWLHYASKHLIANRFVLTHPPRKSDPLRRYAYACWTVYGLLGIVIIGQLLELPQLAYVPSFGILMGMVFISMLPEMLRRRIELLLILEELESRFSREDPEDEAGESNAGIE
ncbi:MAG: hypothetical protein H7A35_07235 [Planctomycetales bacterium]|nr:hypothetical protein [bacterium]UNM09846.1 MAG: hypothetical protein H7A35_07235 [Planctomycetales bacterium]